MHNLRNEWSTAIYKRWVRGQPLCVSFDQPLRSESQHGGQQDVWWRLGETGGSLFWETSADAKSWVRKRTAVSALDASGVRIITGEETTGPMPQTVTIGYDIVGEP